MPRYLFAVRHPAYAELEDDVCGMELPDHAAAALWRVATIGSGNIPNILPGNIQATYVNRANSP